MPEPASPRAADRNLLFGVLALQMDFLSRDALIAGMNAWVLDKARALGQILQEQGVLADDERALLDALVDKHLRKHGGDPEQSLAALVAPAAVREELGRLADPDLDASLSQIGPASEAPTVDHIGADTPLSSAVRYRVLRPHARGGLGEVFVAEDRELHREVALKEIQKPHAHDPHSRNRFLLEAEVNGRLEHPSVVPVYGLGQYPDGRPFYAMRFIRGESLKQAIARFHAADVPGRDPGERRLALRQLLGQFVAVCNAAAYAHSRGVLHRDLKPGNVMLGAFGETLLVDWGLAKVVGRPEAAPVGDEATLRPSAGAGQETQAGVVVGTPGYMSPEQAAGQLDQLGPASDIFSLGATLYTILTGQPSLRGDDLGELLQRIRRGEWLSPRQVKKSVPPALDAVCRKAMALRPQDRYATAQALTDDVEHWLADEPVSAYREPLPQRLGRWRRRHPALAAVSVLLLLAVSAVGVWLKLERDALASDVQAALQEVERQRGHGQWAEARAALERARGRLAGGGPAGLRSRVQQTGADLDMVAALEEARLRQTETRDRRFDLAAADPVHAAAFQRYGLDVLTGDPQETAKRIAASAIREQLVVALDHWVSARPAQDAAGRQRLVVLARLADEDRWRQRLREPEVWKDRQELARLAAAPELLEQPPTTILLLAERFWKAGDPAGGAEVLRRGQQRYPADFWLNHQLAAYLRFSAPTRKKEAIGFLRAAVAARPQILVARMHLGDALAEQGRQQEAAVAFREVLRLKPDYAPGHLNLGNALSRQGQLAEAEAALRQAIRFKADFAIAHSNLGILLRKRGRLDEAEAACRQAIQLDPNYPAGHSNLGLVLADLRRLKEAEAACRQAIKLQADFPDAYNNLGIVLDRQGRLGEAEAAYRQALKLKAAYPEAHFNLGVALAQRKQLPAAEGAFRKAIQLKPDYAEAHNNLGLMLAKQGRPKEAEVAYREAIRLKPNHADAYYNLGLTLAQQRREGEAEAAFREVIRLKPDDPQAYHNLGVALAQQARRQEAEATFREAVRLKPDYAEGYCSLGHALREQGRFDAALTAYRRGHELGSRNPRWRLPSARWIQEAERLLALDQKLSAILKGEAQPADVRERLALARLCQQYKGRHAAAARFYAEAFAEQPKLADDLKGAHRYDAACAAVRASAAGNAPAQEQGRLRQQALDWLQADLAARSRQADQGTPAARAATHKMLRHWQSDADLAAVRDPAALAQLPQAERAAWQCLWHEVAALLKRTAAEQK